MAYYGSNFYNGDTGEYHWTSNNSGYDIVPYQDSITYSSFEFSEHGTTAYGTDVYDPFVTRSEINYSTYNFTEPKFIEYDPYSDSNGYFSSQTQYMISYSTSESNEPEYVEYDPTPYGGGYDLTLTYGKPLPPSDEICYPRSTAPEPSNAGLALDGFSYGSISSPYGKDYIGEYSTKPRNGGKPTGVSEEGTRSNGDESNIGKPLDSNKGEERDGNSYDDGYASSGYDHGLGNGTSEGYGGYECEKQDPQPQPQPPPPYGYGLEAMDLCESLFGYWPCLYRKDQKSNGHDQAVGDEASSSNPWKGAADYLFGSPFGYGERRDEGAYYGDSIYGHGSYYQQ